MFWQLVSLFASDANFSQWAEDASLAAAVEGFANMTVEELLASCNNDSVPPAESSLALQSLWHTKADNWEQAHDIAQDLHTPMGSWLHALLHLIEGDTGNAGYWFRKAGKPVRSISEIDGLWNDIATELLG